MVSTDSSLWRININPLQAALGTRRREVAAAEVGAFGRLEGSTCRVAGAGMHGPTMMGAVFIRHIAAGD